MYIERLKGALSGIMIIVIMLAIRLKLERLIKEPNRIQMILNWNLELLKPISLDGRGKYECTLPFSNYMVYQCSVSSSLFLRFSII
jgi:hypothetical protein